jgi:ElaB/YqjD/DUF883 family membrane-anchored ribosome-binding protein
MPDEPLETSTPDDPVRDNVEPDTPELREARGAVDHAQEELRRAQETYAALREEATQRMRGIREKTVGELVDGGLKFVRQHPGPGVVISAIFGFFLGRLFRR